MKLTVFYAWQSDRPRGNNQDLIRQAAEEALKELQQEYEISESLRLDYSTKGVPGHANIPETIRTKIDNCDIFLADLTFVAKISKKKHVPNPNVIFEIGYGFKSLGTQRFIFVMNTHYGTADKGIFDLAQHTWPLNYELGPGYTKSDRSKALKGLVRGIKGAIKDMIVNDVFASRPEELVGIKSSLETARRNFHNALRDPKFGDWISKSGALAVVLFPERPPENLVDLAKFRHVLREELYLIGKDGYDSRLTKDYFRTFYPPGRGIPNVFTDIFRDGKIFAVNFTLIRPHSVQGRVHGLYIPSQVIETAPATAVFKYLNLLKRLEVRGPYYIGISMLGLPACRMGVDIRIPVGMDQGFDGGDIVPDLIRIDNDVQVSSWEEMASVLKPVFDGFWQDFNISQSVNFDSSGNWVGQ